MAKQIRHKKARAGPQACKRFFGDAKPFFVEFRYSTAISGPIYPMKKRRRSIGCGGVLYAE
ncbi:MAG: hypothetical protein WC421_01715 [Elusimicrobiales bacterium]